MAKILTTKGSVASLEELIRKATTDLYLVSYSFIISDSFITRIKQAADRGVRVHIIYGKSLRSESDLRLEAIKNIRIYGLANLHAKIYLNETKCIIGSMNFSEASELNNTELGVLLSLVSDKDPFEEAKVHALEILSLSQLEFESNRKIRNSLLQNELTGFCIRTGKKIRLDHEKPFAMKPIRSGPFGIIMTTLRTFVILQVKSLLEKHLWPILY